MYTFFSFPQPRIGHRLFHLISPLFLALLFAPGAQAQYGQNSEKAPNFLQFGAKAGLNMGKITGAGFDDAFRSSYHVGGFVRLNIASFLGIQPEVIFSQSQARTVTSFNQTYPGSVSELQTVKLNHLSIPLLLNLGGKRLSVQVGPQYSRLLRQDRTLLQNGRDTFREGEFSGVAGLWAQLGPLNLSGRYIVGLSNLNDITDQQRWRSQNIQLGAGITF